MKLLSTNFEIRRKFENLGICLRSRISHSGVLQCQEGRACTPKCGVSACLPQRQRRQARRRAPLAPTCPDALYRDYFYRGHVRAGAVTTHLRHASVGRWSVTLQFDVTLKCHRAMLQIARLAPSELWTGLHLFVCAIIHFVQAFMLFVHAINPIVGNAIDIVRSNILIV